MKQYISIVCFIILLWGCTPPPQESTGARKIVSFTPAITEILYALDADDMIIGVSDFCKYPLEAQQKQRIGGLFNPNLELLLRLKPTDVFLQGKMATVNRFCDKNGIRLHTITLETRDSITNGIQQIGDALDRTAAAQTLRQNMNEQWQAMTTASHSRNTVPVFICIGREPGPVASCSTANTNTFLSEALTAAGGSNICSDVIGHYPTISAEVLNMRNPAVILDLQPGRTLTPAKYADRVR
jgi:iron complex transport system substrate-binding protein